MKDSSSLSHTKWECKYHVVFIPKYRRKVLYYKLRQYLGDIFRGLAAQRECRIEEGHLMSDHVHMLISIPPKYSVAQVIGFIKGTKARLTLLEHTWDGVRTLQDRAFGRGAITSQPWAMMRRSYGNIFVIKRRKIGGLTS